MDVKIIVGAQSAYACASWNGGSLDVKLPGGRSAPADLAILAAADLAEAARLTARAERMAQMAEILAARLAGGTA